MCEICGKILSSAGSLKVHVEAVHGNSKFDCEDCGMSFECKGTLNNHRRSTHNAPPLMLANESAESTVCRSCGKMFPTVFKLKSHEYKFHRNGVYHCRKCSLTFGSQNERSKHWDRVHRVRNDRKKKLEPNSNESVSEAVVDKVERVEKCEAAAD